MKMTRERKALIAGIIGCLLFVAGDFLYAAVGKDQSTETFGLMVRAAYLDMAAWRMAVSILCGVAGTGLYYVGFHQMYRLLDARLREPGQRKWVKGFRAAYLTGTVCWAYVHAMFMNTALIFKFVYEVYGDVQAAADIANRVFAYNAVPMAAAFLLGDGGLFVVLAGMIWKGMLPLKTTAGRILATLCNPLMSAGVFGNLTTLLPWPLNQLDCGSESLGHALVLVLGLLLLREMEKSGGTADPVKG